jgi:hypothetical protein
VAFFDRKDGAGWDESNARRSAWFPPQSYIQWANGLEEDGVKIGIEFTPEENVYLLPDNEAQQDDLETLLAPYSQTCTGYFADLSTKQRCL